MRDAFAGVIHVHEALLPLVSFLLTVYLTNRMSKHTEIIFCCKEIVMAYVVMACVVMAYIVGAYIVIYVTNRMSKHTEIIFCCKEIVMAYIVMACVVMAYGTTAYLAMAYIVMATASRITRR